MPVHKNIRYSLLAVSFSCLFLLTSCGRFFVPPTGGGGGTSCSNCVYIANSGSDDVAAFAVTNPLTVASSTNVAVGDAPSSLAVSGDYLFAGSVNSGIYLFPIQSGGSLGTAVLESSSVTPYALAVDSTGAWLLTASLDVNGTAATCKISGDVAVLLSVFPIGSSGELSTGTSYVTSTSNPVCASSNTPPADLIISPNGKYIFMAVGSVGMLGYNFDSTSGVPSYLSSGKQSIIFNASTTSINGVAIDPTSTYLFVSGSGSLGGLAQYKISDSAITSASTTQTPINSFYAVTAPASGNYVYVTDRSSGKVYGFSYSSTGNLTAITGSPFAPSAASSGTIAIVTDSSSKYVMTINNSTGPNIQQFTIGTKGALTASSTGTTSSGTYAPVALAVTGSGS